MKKYILVALVILLVGGLVRAESFSSTVVDMNGTGTVSSSFINNEIQSTQVVEIDGDLYFEVSYYDGTSEIIEYIETNEQKWSEDNGADMDMIVDKVEGAIDWLLGKNKDPDDFEMAIGIAIDDYQKNNPYTQELLQRIVDLQYRVEALENTAESTNAEAYCEGKMGVMESHNLKGVKCEDTYYRNHLESPSTGESIVIGLTPVNKPTPPEDTASLESEEDKYSLESKQTFDETHSSCFSFTPVQQTEVTVDLSNLKQPEIIRADLLPLTDLAVDLLSLADEKISQLM